MKKKIKVTPYDTANYLKTEKDIAGFLCEVLKENDPAFFADALGIVARARATSKIAKKAGMSLKIFNEALANPELGSILAIMNALGVRFTVAKTAIR